MVDDLICISSCGKNSVLLNGFINVSNIKKLKFGETQCHKIIVGKDKRICPDLIIDKWEIKPIEEVKTNDKSSLDDVYAGSHLIPDTNQEKHLGDIISNSGKNDSNITARVNKGKGITKQIMTILGDICLGKYY